MKKRDKFETNILIITIALGAVISILDFTGLLENVGWLAQKIPSLTLLLVSLIATSLLLGTLTYRDLLSTVIPYGIIRKFDRDKESFEYMLRRIQEAKASIDDITWENPYRATIVFDEGDQEKYLRTIEKVSRKIKYREIIMFCGKKSRKEQMVRLLEQGGRYFETAIFEDFPENSAPRFGFLIIDDEEVILGKIAIRHPDIVDFFSHYYDDLWKNAKPVKVAGTLDNDFYENLKRSLSAD